MTRGPNTHLQACGHNKENKSGNPMTSCRKTETFCITKSILSVEISTCIYTMSWYITNQLDMSTFNDINGNIVMEYFRTILFFGCFDIVSCGFWNVLHWDPGQRTVGGGILPWSPRYWTYSYTPPGCAQPHWFVSWRFLCKEFVKVKHSELSRSD